MTWAAERAKSAAIVAISSALSGSAASPPGMPIREGPRTGPQPLIPAVLDPTTPPQKSWAKKRDSYGREALGQGREAGDLALVEGVDRVAEGARAERRGGQLLAEHQADAAPRALLVERQVAVGDQAVLAVLHGHRRGHHPVRQHRVAEGQRLEERTEIHLAA